MVAEREGFVLAHSDPGTAGEPLLLVHGFSHSHVVWEPLSRGLSAGFRPIAVDLRGHGDSPWSPESHYDVADHAADLATTLDALGIARCWVVGHSLGGNASTIFAATHPDRVAGLVLVDTGPTLSVAGASQIAEEVDETLRSWPSVEAFQARLELILPLAEKSVIARMAAHGVVRRLDGRFEPRLDPGILGGGGRRTLSASEALAAMEAEIWEALARIRCPVLLVRGAQSAVLAEAVAQRMVEDVLEDARCLTFEGSGHAVMLDEPDRLRRTVEAFVAGRFEDSVGDEIGADRVAAAASVPAP